MKQPLIATCALLIGIGGTLGWQEYRKAEAYQKLPSLEERQSPSGIDECAWVRLYRSESKLLVSVGSSMGRPYENLDAMLRLERWKPDEHTIFHIAFDEGVTDNDLSRVVEYLTSQGVRRFFIGHTLYAKTLESVAGREVKAPEFAPVAEQFRSPK